MRRLPDPATTPAASAAPPEAEQDEDLDDDGEVNVEWYPVPAWLEDEWPDDETPAATPSALAARGDPTATDPVRFERVDAPEHVAQSVDALIAEAHAALQRALLATRDMVLDALPGDASSDALADVEVSADALREALDDVARLALQRVRDDLARKFRLIDREQAAARVEARASRGLLSRLRDRLTAADTADEELPPALRAYMQWALALNRALADRESARLANDLRIRILQAYSTGASLEDVARAVASEFASYSASQLDTLVRTSVFDYYNSARNHAFDAAGDYVRGVRFVALEDRHTTPFCRAIHGRSIARSDPLYERLRSPPFYYNCRTTIVPVLADDAGHEFDRDWGEWLNEHRDDQGGGFIYGDT